MPEPNKGETKIKYIPRCISITKKHHPEWALDKVIAVCHNMWETKNMSEEKMEEFSLSAPLEIVVEKKKMTEPGSYTIIKNNEIEQIDYISGDELQTEHYATAIIADKFYQGAFFPAAEVKKVYKQWEGTLHDINHMGTTHLMGLSVTSDIRFFVGWNSDVSYNPESKAVSMKVNIDNDTKYANVWHSYINLCKKAGQKPNVSIHFYGLKRLIRAGDLPEDVNYEQYGFKKDDEVLYVYNIIPKALSTVLTGVCNDKTGCGIETNNCASGTHILSETELQEIEDERQLLIKQLNDMEA